MHKISTENRLGIIYGELNDDISELCFELLNLNENDKKEGITSPFHLIINTQGGALYATLHLCDIIHSMTSHVYTYASGYCQSGGILILLAGKRKFSFPYTSFLMHSPIFYRETSYANIKNAMINVENENIEYINYIKKYSNLKAKDVNRIFSSNADVCFTASDALSMGLIDEITEHIVIDK